MFQDKSRASGSPDIVTFKTVDQSVTDSTVLEDDDHLFATLKSGRKYSFRAVLFSTPGDGGIKVGFTGSATYFIAKAIAGKESIAVVSPLLDGISDTIEVTNVDPPATIFIDGYIEPSADGAFQIQFAQSSSDPVAATLKKGSYFLVWRVA